MQGEIEASPQPKLDDKTRSFVRRALSAGLVEVDQLKQVVALMMTEDDRFTDERLADGLVGASVLTQWQANKLLAGKSKGFNLGSYQLLRPLGKGGMGVVYLGEHHVMKRLMALKILPPEATKDKRRIDRFKAEARACAKLDHPNIVCAYDFVEAKGKLFIVMEYVDGIDLHHLVRRDGPLSVSDAVDVLVQSTEGLAHAHERGIVHRDIKPSNLLLRTDGVVKVSDLGLAKIGWSESEEERRVLGTTDFLAPEQAINSKNVDARADIYSLGCTLYYLLTGQVPFEGTSSQRLAKHQTTPVPDVRILRSDCPASVAELVQRMTAKRPDDRPKSASELLSQVKRLSGITRDVTTSRLGHVAPASDSSIEDTIFQGSNDDTSLSADGEVPVAIPLDDEFDFASLPDVPVESDDPVSNPHGAPIPSYRMTPALAADRKSKPKFAVATVDLSSNQQVLLGVGLTIAVIALLTVVGIGVRTLLQPLPVQQQTIKAFDSGSRIEIHTRSAGE